jgi:hypothetical protein
MSKYRPYKYKVIGFEGFLISTQLFKNQLSALKFAATLFKPELYEIDDSRLRLISDKELTELIRKRVMNDTMDNSVRFSRTEAIIR